MTEIAMNATFKNKKSRKREGESQEEQTAEAHVENTSSQEEAHVPGRFPISPEAVESMIAEAEYQQHPYGKVWQRFDLDALAELAGNINRRGLDQEILLYQGMILEGWHRYLACLATKTTPKFAEFQGSDLEAAERVHASGIRRQSTPEQRYASFVLLCEACPAFKEKYEQLKEQGIQQQQAGKPLSTDGQRVDVVGAKAAAAGVSRSTAAKVEKVKKEEPGAVADIAAGKTSANKVLNKTTKKAPPPEPHTLSFPSSAVAKGEEDAQDAGPVTASFAGDEPANVLEPPSDEDEAQDEEQPGLVINYDIKATVTLANGINAATFEDESLYDQKHLGDWSAVAEWSKRVLKPGGLFFAFTGSMQLDQVLCRCSEHLHYEELFAIRFSAPYKAWYSDKRAVLKYTKNAVLYSKGEWQTKKFVKNYLLSPRYEKKYYKYELPLEPVMYWLERFTNRGDLVVDPFGGSWTVAVAARRLHRRFIGADIKPGCRAIWEKRMRNGD
jgi:hypothetical protein